MRKTLLIAILTAAGVAHALPCAAKSYAIESLKIAAVLSEDGSVRVTEDISYQFRGSFTYAYRDIPVGRGEEVLDVAVTEGGRPYNPSEQDAPWTFSVSRTAGKVRVTWRYAAEDEPRTFGISYRMKGPVRRYADVAEFYYKFVGEEWDRPIARVDAEVRLPEAAKASDIRAWAHGPLHGTVSILSDGRVSFGVSPLPAGSFWEARIVCPSDVFADMRTVSGEPRLEAILAEEAAWADEANRAREEGRKRLAAAAAEHEMRAGRAASFLPLSIVLGLGALGVWFGLYMRHGRPHRVVSRAAPGEIPSDHPPAVVSYLMSRTVTGPAVAATLIDLAHRGYLEIHETAADARGPFGKKRRRAEYRFDVVAKPLSDLRAYERDLLRFVLKEVGDGRGFAVSALEKAASKKRAAFQRFFRGWVREVSDEAKTFGFYEPYPKREMALNAVCGAGVLAAGVAMSVGSQAHAGIAAVAGGFLQAILTVGLSRRTPEGRRLMLAWKAFRTHLKSVGRGLGPVSLEAPQWGSFVVAAVLFGLHKRILPNLKLDDGHGGVIYPVWFHGSEIGGLDGGVSGLASGLSTMVSAVSTASSSAAGTGGGASGGGGGGSGGGGGGAG